MGILKVSFKNQPPSSCACGCVIFVLLFNTILGGFCFDYLLNYLFMKNIPLYLDCLCGLIGGEVIVVLAIICFILSIGGVQPPLF